MLLNLKGTLLSMKGVAKQSAAQEFIASDDFKVLSKV